MTNSEIQNIVGKWVVITGDPRISEKSWKYSFPQDWFGKVIGYKIKMKTIFFEIRCYRPVKRDDGKREKHPHLNSRLEYLKIIQ
jgi:hypothetical protein